MNSLPFGVDALVKSLTDPGGGEGKDDPFEFSAGGLAMHAPKVVSFSGHERVNGLYRYRVVIATRAPLAVVDASVYGQSGRLTIKAPDHEPQIREGIVSRMAPLDPMPSEPGRYCYRLEIVPKLWLLTLHKRNRIYEDRTPQEIIEELLAEHEIKPEECRWRIRSDKYPRIPFTYQRDESDYDFFRRVLASAGIHFFFEHPSGTLDDVAPVAAAAAGAAMSAASLIGGAAASTAEEIGNKAKLLTVLNFGDEAGHTVGLKQMAVANEAIGSGIKSLASAIGGDTLAGLIEEDPCDSLPFDAHDGAGGDSERILSFSLEKQLRPKSIHLRELDPEASRLWESHAQTTSVKPSLDVDLGVRVDLKHGVSAKAAVKVGLDVDAPSIRASAVHEDEYQLDPSLRWYANGEERARVELERRRVDYLRARGRSDCRRLAAGYRFLLAEHPIEEFNIEYTVVALESHGLHPDYVTQKEPIYRNAFEVLPAKYAPRPRRRKRRRPLQPEVATVLGFDGRLVGSHLNTNACAHVRVRFHWDVDARPRPRKGIHGATFAGQSDRRTCFIPVGQPSAGPGYGTQFIPREGMHVVVGFLGGDNERPFLMTCLYDEQNVPPFAEAADQQKMGWRSRSRPSGGSTEFSEISTDDRRGRELVKIRSQRDLDVDVLREARARIEANAIAHVHGDAMLDVGGDSTTRIAGTERRAVQGDQVEKVAGAVVTTIEGSRRMNVEGGLSAHVGGRREVTVMGNERVLVNGSRVVTLRDEDITTIGRRQIVTVGDGEASAESDTRVHGKYRVSAAKDIVLESEHGIILRVPGAEVRLTGERLALLASAVNIAASKELELSGSGPTLRLGSDAQIVASQIRLQGSSSRLSLDDAAELTGTHVNFGQGARAERVAEIARQQGAVEVPLTFLDTKHQPRAHCRFQLEIEGRTIEGSTDAEGRIMVALPRDVTTLRCILWTGDFPEGPREVYDIPLVELPDPHQLEGARARLVNLGYYSGDSSRKIDGMDGPTRDALLEFQRAHELKPTGLLDEATAGKLADIHP